MSPLTWFTQCCALCLSCSCVNEYGRLWFPLQNCFNRQRRGGEDLLSPSLHSGKSGHLLDCGMLGWGQHWFGSLEPVALHWGLCQCHSSKAFCCSHPWSYITYSDILAHAARLYLVLHLALFWSLCWRNLILSEGGKSPLKATGDNSSCFSGVLGQL